MKLDNTIDLEQIIEKSGYHHATAVDALIETGVTRDDAEAFVTYAFDEHACLNGGDPSIYPTEESLTDAQWNRIS